MELSEKIKEARQKKQLTLDELAKAVESSKSYIWQIEKDPQKKPSFDLIVKIARVLELPLDYLADEDSTMTSKELCNIRLLKLFNKLDNESRDLIEALIKQLTKK